MPETVKSLLSRPVLIVACLIIAGIFLAGTYVLTVGHVQAEPNEPPTNSFVNMTCVKNCENMLISDPKYIDVDAKYCYQICQIAPPPSPTPEPE